MNRTIIIASTLLATMTTGALADRIDNRQAQEAARIEQGRRSGQLTVMETLKLKAEQARIADMERRAKSDGVVTHREAKAIDRAQDAASRHIYQESHDSQKAWWK